MSDGKHFLSYAKSFENAMGEAYKTLSDLKKSDAFSADTIQFLSECVDAFDIAYGIVKIHIELLGQEKARKDVDPHKLQKNIAKIIAGKIVSDDVKNAIDHICLDTGNDKHIQFTQQYFAKLGTTISALHTTLDTKKARAKGLAPK